MSGKKEGKVRVKKKKPGLSSTQRRKAKKKVKDEALVRSVKESLSAVRHDSSELIVVSAMVDGRYCKDVLIDPGATSNFIQRGWATGTGMHLQKLSKLLDVTLADGTTNKSGQLTHAVKVKSLSTQGSEAPCTLTVMNELSHQVIAGMPWLRAAGVTVRGQSSLAQHARQAKKGATNGLT
jgi:hypothetical protein